MLPHYNLLVKGKYYFVDNIKIKYIYSYNDLLEENVKWCFFDNNSNIICIKIKK
jgi:hypothetical protein